MEAGTQPISLTLSVEELLVVLNALETPSIPGLEAQGWVGLTTEQQDLTLSVAQRALEARGLAMVDEVGQLRLHTSLLTAVGVCAYPERTALVENWAPDANAALVFAHTLDDENVVHTVNPTGHTFVLLPSEAALVEHLTTVCAWGTPGATGPEPLELTVPRADFTRACDSSAAGERDAALEALGSATGSDAARAALIDTLTDQPRISIVQLLRADDNQQVQEDSYTLIAGRERTWLVSELTAAVDAPLRARTVAPSDISGTLLNGR